MFYNSIPAVHLHSCWQSRSCTTGEGMCQKKTIRHAPFISCLFLIDDSAVKGELFQNLRSHRAPTYNSSEDATMRILLLKRFLSNFQTSIKQFLELTKCSNHAKSYDFRYFTYHFSWEQHLLLTLNLHYSFSFWPRNTVLLSLKPLLNPTLIWY